MFLGLLLLLPLVAEGSILGNLFCSLPDASTESLNITTANKTWYVNYQYAALPGMSALAGCILVTQSPGDSDNQITIYERPSKLSSLAFSGTATYDGNRMNVEVDGPLGLLLSVPHNVVWSEEDIFIEHFCVAGTEMANILTTYENPSNEVIERIWKIVEDHSEVDRKKFSKVDC
ncbi:uncharacterized protein LOC124709116 [Schistocerca piceifrons]|uniref:uncharacterized protein LOC124709116 n=1 Tax=Schistocerca piceifrons TaxID=274613 RepID=UPI001F5EBC4E|nr:uncharacterized protein LOC124709116 [Schistocerca piceifrons]